MALLTGRSNKPGRSNSATSHTSVTEQNAPCAPRISPAGASELAARPPLDTLLTLKARLQARIDRDNRRDELDDPETRSILLSVRRRLDQVNMALARIEQGKYGICIDCHKPVENERMVLQSFSTRCISCRTVAEWRGGTY